MLCPQLLSELSRLKSLKRDFDLEFEKAATTRKTQTAEDLKDQLKQLAKTLSEKLEPHRFKEIREREEKRNKDFFGEKFYNENIKIPRLPKGITKEMVESWEKQGFRLEYWPKVDMTKDRADKKLFPGWERRPGKEYTPNKQFGISFYDDLQSIQNLPENQNNPHLINPKTNKPYKLTELPGAWVLEDTRPKPNYDKGNQTYENDTLIQKALTNLKSKDILNSEATSNRNRIHPSIFNKPEFWQEIKDALGIDPSLNATIRLPRLIEQNYRGQGTDFHDTDTYEWSEEYYQSGLRLICGNSDDGGASGVSWSDDPDGDIGFRPLIVFNK